MASQGFYFSHSGSPGQLVQRWPLNRNQRPYQQAEDEAGRPTTTASSGQQQQQHQQPLMQWPYMSSLESLQLDQSLSLFNSNKLPELVRGQPGRAAAPNVWHSQQQQQLRRPLVGGQCSTFAAADVRRALRLVTSNQCSLSSFALPPSGSSASHLRRRGKLALEPKGCNISVGCPTPAQVEAAEACKFKCAKQTTTNECKITVDREEEPNDDDKQAASSLYSTLGPPVDSISYSNCNLNSSQSINESLPWPQQVKQTQQPASKSLQDIKSTQTEHPQQAMQSIHSLSMQLERQTSIVQQQQQQPTLQASQAQQRQLSASISTNSLTSNKLGRLVGKKASRVKELLLQNLGRADRTHDQMFDVYEENFFKQQHQAHKIAKEFKSYLVALKSFHEAGKSLNTCIQQSTSDYQSARHDLVCENLAQMEQLNEDLVEKLREQVMVNIGQYLTQFGELKDKISKRHRKLIDFDSSRRAFELTLSQIQKKRQQRADSANNNLNNSQQAASHFPRSLKFLSQQQHQQQQQVDGQGDQDELSAASQLVDETRLLKLREQFNYCKIMYETINSELHDELPTVYEKKMKSLLMTLQNYFALEAHYHSNAGKLMATASDVIDELPELTAAGLVRRHQQARNDAQYGGQAELDEEDDVDDDDDDDDDDQDDEHDHQAQQVLGQTNVNASASSNDLLYDASQVVGQKGVVGLGGGGGGGSSSGVGSSRADSSSCPDTSASSSASSPDIAGQAKQSEEADRSGKADEPAEEVHEAEEEHQPQVVLVSSPSPSSAGQHQSDAGSADTAGVVYVAGEQKEQQQPQVASSEIAVIGESEPTVDGASREIVADAQVATTSEAGEHLGLPDEEPKSQDDQNKVISDNSQVVGVIDEPDAKEQTIGGESPAVQSGQLQPAQAGHLYKVKTNYKYLAEDVDELCFEADEILQVVQFDPSQEPEEGWLMGIREVNGQRGLFPANFTRPI